MKITVLGGAGKMGCIAVQDLTHDPRVEEVVIGDINLEQAREVAEYINSPKIKIKGVDLANQDELIELLGRADACLNATVYYTNLQVMEACLEAGTHYTDMGGLFHTTRKQLKLHDRFAERDLSAVLGMGSAPGVPNVQSRYAADRLDTIESVRIYDGIKPSDSENTIFTYAVPTIVDELTVEPMVFSGGKFEAREPLSGFEDYCFVDPVGILPMHLSLHSEVATIPISFQEKGVQECFFKIDYWGMSRQTVEKVRVLAEFGFDSTDPVDVNGQRIIPREVMVAMLSGNVPPITDFLKPAPTSPPDWSKEIVTEIRGTKAGEEVTYRLGTKTCRGALPTGVGPAITAVWLAEGRIEPGVYPPELALEPEPFFDELKEREIFTDVSVRKPL